MSDNRPLVVRLGSPLENPEREIGIIEEAGGTLQYVEARDEATALAAIRDADIAINAGGIRFSEAVFAHMRRCRAVIQCSVGYDRIEVPAATARGIMIANLPDYCIEEVADHAVALTLASARRLFQMQRVVRDGKWAGGTYDAIVAAIDPIERLSERTFGIIGFGNIGKLVAKKTKGIFNRLLAADPWVKPEMAALHGAELVSLEELLAQSDYVTLHVLLTTETRHMINAERLALMKPTAYLVNTCRGPIVDEVALTEALRAGKLAGAGLDVFEVEPIGPDHPLANMDNVIVTPHLAVRSQTAMWQWRIQPIDDAARIIRGYYPRGMVNRDLKNTLGLKEPVA
jgi:D-3-phosphoglycerate dehydrogenase